MKIWNDISRWPLAFLTLITFAGLCPASDPGSTGRQPANSIIVAVNQDTTFPAPNATVFYSVNGTQLTYQSATNTGGYGIQGGFFGTSRVSSVPSLSAPCIYASDASSNDIASISLPSQQLVGTFFPSSSDDGSTNGIGLAVNANYLYASFTASNTIGTFSLQTGCGLTFLGDVSALGLQGGSISGMAVNGTILVVAYGDGSIESFNVAGGLPVSNGDRQNSNGYTGTSSCQSCGSGSLPSGVDLTADGQFALFGDIAAKTIVEVSSLTTGKLAPTAVYHVGNAVDAGAIRLSPDESLLYIANSEAGSVTAAFFDKTLGTVASGCTSRTLKGFNALPWLGSVLTRDPTGTGNILYVDEFARDTSEVNHGAPSQIGILTITSNGTSCSLTETSTSPVLLTFPGALSIGVYPPRPF